MNREVVLPWPAQPEHRTPCVPAIKVKVPGATLLFMSGMGATGPDHARPHVPEERGLPDDAAEQARRALDKIRRIAETAGGGLQHVVKITRYFRNIADQDKVDDVIREYFGETLPCSTTVAVSAFVVPAMLLEFDAWAVIPDVVPTRARKPAHRGKRAVATRAAKRPAARKRPASKRTR